MHILPMYVYDNRDNSLGYTWKSQAELGTVFISEDELFGRIEFQHFTEHDHKVKYAMDLGWRYNVDNGRWYRLKSF